MAGRGTSSGHPRVVVLSRYQSLRVQLATSGLNCMQVDGAYQAAAELLAQPTGVLAIDLRELPARHLGLLKIARSKGVAMLAFGPATIPLNPHQLVGVRLIAQADLAGELQQRTAGAEAATPPSPTPMAAVASVATPAPEAAQRPAQPPAKTPAAAPQVQLAPAKPAAPGPATAPPMPAAVAASPGSLLTPEELSALLEDDL